MPLPAYGVGVILGWTPSCISLVTYGADYRDIEDKLHAYGVQQITIAVEKSEYINVDGQGFLAELSKAVFSPLNIPVRYHFATFRKALIAVDRGNADLAYGMSNNLPGFGIHNIQLLFSNFPVFDEEVQLLCRKQLPCSKKALFENPNARYAEYNGYGYAKRYRLPQEIGYVVSIPHAAKLMRENRLDYMLHDITGKGVVDKAVYSSYNNTLFSFTETYAGFTNNERGALLLHYFDRRIIELIISGELINIYQQGEDEGPWNLPIPSQMKAWIVETLSAG